MLEPADVLRTADALRIEAKLHHDLGDAATVERAAEALGVSPAQIGKSIVLMVSEAEPVVVLVPGTRRADLHAVADHVRADVDAVRMATPEEVERFTGYPVGGVPPFGYARPVRTLVDQALLEHEQLFMGGGSDEAMLELDASGLRRLPDVSLGRFSGGR